MSDLPSYDWRAPSPPPPWTTVSDDDDRMTKNLKVEIAFQYKSTLFFWEKYRAKKRYSEELESFAQQYTKGHCVEEKDPGG